MGFMIEQEKNFIDIVPLFVKQSQNAFYLHYFILPPPPRRVRVCLWLLGQINRDLPVYLPKPLWVHCLDEGIHLNQLGDLPVYHTVLIGAGSL